MRLITGIDTAMPDVRGKWNYHARWNQNDVFWPEDFKQLADCGFNLLRWQVPWSLVEPRHGEYRWDLIDPKVELASKLGMEIFYPIVHFNLPSWAADGGKHAAYSTNLAEYLAEYTEALLSRYHFRFVIPVVEVQMDAFQRGLAGNWGPHHQSRTAYRAIYSNLIKAFKASAAIARAHGAIVFCSEPAPEIDTVLDLKDSINVAGIDLYPHMHTQWTVLGYLRHWWNTAHVPLCISEFDIPETYNPSSGRDEYDRFVQAGSDEHRAYMADELYKVINQARDEGIPIPYGGWYPGTGNIGWGLSLTREREKADCDRAGLIDLARREDGTLERVPCPKLIEKVMKLGRNGSAMQEQISEKDSVTA